MTTSYNYTALMEEEMKTKTPEERVSYHRLSLYRRLKEITKQEAKLKEDLKGCLEDIAYLQREGLPRVEQAELRGMETELYLHQQVFNFLHERKEELRYDG